MDVDVRHLFLLPSLVAKLNVLLVAVALTAIGHNNVKMYVVAASPIYEQAY